MLALKNVSAGKKSNYFFFKILTQENLLSRNSTLVTILPCVNSLKEIQFYDNQLHKILQGYFIE